MGAATWRCPGGGAAIKPEECAHRVGVLWASGPERCHGSRLFRRPSDRAILL